jgi:translation initiation factor 1
MNAKARIPLAGAREDLQSPFAALNIPGLPEGPADVEKIPVSKPGRVVLRKEKAHRGGKAVIVVSGFLSAVSDQHIEDLARAAKKHCGSGGTVRESEIEIQGEETSRIRRFFEQQGFRVDGI